MKIEKDFYNTTTDNDEFFILPMLSIEWYDGYAIHFAFLCWRGYVIVGGR